MNLLNKYRWPIAGLVVIAVIGVVFFWQNEVYDTSNPGTLKLAIEDDLTSLDPYLELSNGMLQYSHIVFDPLVRWTKDMQPEGRLASKWERIDANTMRFTLREEVKFHSGNPFTAADVKWTFDRFKKSKDFQRLFEPLKEVNIIDDYTVDIITVRPYSFILNIAAYIFPMDSKFYTGIDEKSLPKDLIDKTQSFALTHESGTGKFRVIKRKPGAETVLEVVKDYWDVESPGDIEKIIMKPIKDGDKRVSSLLSGEVGFIMSVPPENYEKIGSKKNYQIVTLPGSSIILLELNQKRLPEIRDERVRQAIVQAIDNDKIAGTIMKGAATPATQLTPHGFIGHNEGLKPRYNLEKAKALMTEAGFPNGFNASMIAPRNLYMKDEEVAKAIVEMLAEINIKVNLKVIPDAQYMDQFNAQAADITMIGWSPETGDSSNYSEYLAMCRNKETGYGKYNTGNYCNQKVDELVLASLAEDDPEQRDVLLQEVEQILYDEAVFVPLYWPNLSWAGRKDLKIEKIVNIMNTPYFGDLEINM